MANFYPVSQYFEEGQPLGFTQLEERISKFPTHEELEDNGLRRAIEKCLELGWKPRPWTKRRSDGSECWISIVSSVRVSFTHPERDDIKMVFGGYTPSCSFIIKCKMQERDKRGRNVWTSPIFKKIPSPQFAADLLDNIQLIGFQGNMMEYTEKY